MAPICNLLISIYLSLCFVASTAYASGAEGPYDDFVSRVQPDLDLDLYESGNLGVLLPTYPRVFLYPAWRAILLGKKLSSDSVAKSGKLQDACCKYVSDWVDILNPSSPQALWLASRSTILSEAPRVKLAVQKKASPTSYTYFRNCSDSAYLTVQTTLEALKSRKDATSKRLSEWVAAQDSVFEFCGYTEGETGYNIRIDPPPEVPQPLSDKEPKYWKQVRSYQIASAMFYAGDYQEASDLFQTIAIEKGNPMQKWGLYLSLRSQIRKLTLSPLTDMPKTDVDEALLNEVETIAATILNDPKLAFIHEATKASMRTVKFKLMPNKRFEELSEQLNDWHKDPYIEDALPDWRRLANDLINDYEPSDTLIDSLRKQYSYFDWIRTIQSCMGTLKRMEKYSCAAEASHAKERWKQSLHGKSVESRAWLVAVLMTAADTNTEIIAEANKVSESAPEYQTVQYYMIKLLHQAGKIEAARKLADTQLTKPFTSQSAFNLFLQQRFSMAVSLQDASHFLTRTPSVRVNKDTHEVHILPGSGTRLDYDGSNWLNYHLSIIDLLKLTEIETLPLELRQKIAIAALSRADLLKNFDLANKAAQKVESLSSSLSTYTKSYIETNDELLKRHILLMGGINNKISPIIDWKAGDTGYDRPPEDATASMWCVIEQQPNYNEQSLGQFSISPELSEDSKTRDAEMQGLSKIGTATGVFTKHMLAYQKSYPSDPDNPWLLYVAVHSSRGGCVDKDNAVTSRKAWGVLHSKYKGSSWSKKTPYWYGR